MTEPTIVTAYNQADAELNRVKAQVDLVTNRLNNLKASLTYHLRVFAENHLDSSDSSYEDLHDIMVDHDLGGLKRNYTVTVRVTYSFDVEVEAVNEDDAQQQVEDNIGDYAADNIYLSDVYDSEIDSIYES